jgi:hypothetical protein
MPNPNSKLHMAVTELFDGGIANTPKIAEDIARLVLGSLAEAASGPTTLFTDADDLSVEDRAETWLVTAAPREPSSGRGTRTRHIEIRKRDAMVNMVNCHEEGDLIANPAVAEKFALAILGNTAGEAELRRQLPLTVSDNAQTWVVKGSGNAARAHDGPGPFTLELQKANGRVLDMWFEWVLAIPPDVRTILRDSARKPNREQ